MRRFVLSAAVMLIAAVTISVTVAVASVGASSKVPTCTGFNRFHYRVAHPVLNDRSETHGLLPAIDKLVCSAADHSTIDIKSWFLRVDDAAIARVVGHLRLMHRYHGVRVNVHVGRAAYPPYTIPAAHRPTYEGLKHWFSFAHVYSCLSSCWHAHEGNISHSKWMTVSRLRKQPDSAVLSTSANWSHQQFALTKQSALLTIGHPALYRAFTGRFAQYVDCALHGRCHHALPQAHWQGSRGAWVYFAPAFSDPIVKKFDRLRCSAHSRVDITSLLLTRPGVLRALRDLKARGCPVRALLEHPVTRATHALLHPRCETIHDKSIYINTPNSHVVIAGSEDIGGGGLHGNDNVMVLTGNPTSRRQFAAFFTHNWAHSHACAVEG